MIPEPDDLDLMRPVLEHVAADRARREGRPIAVERCPVHWTCRPAAEPTPAGYERLAVLDPGDKAPAPYLGECGRCGYVAEYSPAALAETPKGPLGFPLCPRCHAGGAGLIDPDPAEADAPAREAVASPGWLF